MAIKYKIDVLAELKKAGYTTTRLRKEKILAEGVLTSIRKGDTISMKNIDVVCRLLNCQPGDIIEYVEDEN